MAGNWVDFKAVKDAVTMEMALDHFQVNWLRKEKQELVGRCPIHAGEGERAFHVSLSKNAFNCFSCKARGNVLDFIAAMEKCSVRDAAFKLSDWFAIASPAEESTQKTAAKHKPEPTAKAATTPDSALVNKPLSFQLKNIDHAHPYLASRGISKEVAERFGVGFFSGKGSMSGRIVFPIHNDKGELVAYAGRAIESAAEERYRFPAGFYKSAELYNLHRAMAETNLEKPVVLVEGFFDCMKVSEAGFACVALMGSSLSDIQEQLLYQHFRQVVVLLDGDEAGQKASNECLQKMALRQFVRVVALETGQQPDMLSSETLRQLLENNAP